MTTTASNLGVTLDFLNSFVASRIALDPEFKCWTTRDVLNRIIKPETLETNSSFCSYSLKDGSFGNSIKTPNIFVVHGWDSVFIDVYEALRFQFNDESSTAVFWIDIFSSNQHVTGNRNQWWKVDLKRLITSFHRTVVVFAPWKSSLYRQNQQFGSEPIPLTRTRCLYELFLTADLHSELEVAMSERERNEFYEDIQYRPDSVTNTINGIDMRRTEASRSQDRDEIFDAVRKDKGFDYVNSRVQSILHTWVVSTVKAIIGHEHMEEHTAYCFRKSLGRIYFNQGKYDLAEPLLLASLEYFKRALGDEDDDTVNAQSHIGALYWRMDRYADAEPMCEAAYLGSKALYGSKDQVTLTAQNRLATLYTEMDKFDKAEPLYTDCLNTRLAINPDHPYTLNTMDNLATLKSKVRQFAEAERLRQRCLEGRKRVLGALHPVTLLTIYNYATGYYNQDRYADAEPLYEQCFQGRLSIYGRDHADTVRAQEALANCRERMKATATDAPRSKAATEEQRPASSSVKSSTSASVSIVRKSESSQKVVKGSSSGSCILC